MGDFFVTLSLPSYPSEIVCFGGIRAVLASQSVSLLSVNTLCSFSRPHNVLIPKKGTKKNPLLKEEKEDHRIISSFRVVIEHAIAGVKRFQIVTNTLRNKIGLFDDLIIEVCSGLWNFHLRYRR